MSERLRDKLKSEIMATGWDDLVAHFARGALVMIAPHMDLLDAAEAIARDDKARVEAWLSAGALWRTSDAEARAFTEQPGTRFQFVIVQPWVLAQVLAPAMEA